MRNQNCRLTPRRERARFICEFQAMINLENIRIAELCNFDFLHTVLRILSLHRVQFLPVSRYKTRYLDWHFVIFIFVVLSTLHTAVYKRKLGLRARSRIGDTCTVYEAQHGKVADSEFLYDTVHVQYVDWNRPRSRARYVFPVLMPGAEKT